MKDNQGYIEGNLIYMEGICENSNKAISYINDDKESIKKSASNISSNKMISDASKNFVIAAKNQYQERVLALINKRKEIKQEKKEFDELEMESNILALESIMGKKKAEKYLADLIEKEKYLFS